MKLRENATVVHWSTDRARTRSERFVASYPNSIATDVRQRGYCSYTISNITSFFAREIDTTGLQPDTPLSANPEKLLNP